VGTYSSRYLSREHEGPAAFNRFQDAVKAILKVSKADLPPSPFGKRKAAKKKAKPKRG
jgi:hypothetical protein